MSELAPIGRSIHSHSPSATCALVQNGRKTLAVFAIGSKLMVSFALRSPLPTRTCVLTHNLLETSLDDL